MFNKILNLLIAMAFAGTLVTPIPQAHADGLLGLPEPGAMVSLSPAFKPVIIKAVTIHKDNPFMFDFIVDVGQDHAQGAALKKEGEKLIKYFLASLTIPEKDLWVNLSPYEKDRTIPQVLGQTEMGRDLLAEDYMLKQITASLIYPEKGLGKTFWDKVYTETRQQYGNVQIPVNTFNKVWIMADKAEIYEHNNTVFLVGSHLKVMLEEDYLALKKHLSPNRAHTITSQVVREIILPQLEKEVNQGQNFANLRQVFSSLILASWYKKNLKEALLNQIYADKKTVKGIDLKDPNVKEQIYQRYLKAYKKGVFNFIKEDANGSQGEFVARKYFSGGVVGEVDHFTTATQAMMTQAISDGDQDGDAVIRAGVVPGYGTTNSAMTPQRSDLDKKLPPPAFQEDLQREYVRIFEQKGRDGYIPKMDELLKYLSSQDVLGSAEFRMEAIRIVAEIEDYFRLSRNEAERTVEKLKEEVADIVRRIKTLPKDSLASEALKARRIQIENYEILFYGKPKVQADSLLAQDGPVVMARNKLESEEMYRTLLGLGLKKDEVLSFLTHLTFNPPSDEIKKPHVSLRGNWESPRGRRILMGMLNHSGQILGINELSFEGVSSRDIVFNYPDYENDVFKVWQERIQLTRYTLMLRLLKSYTISRAIQVSVKGSKKLPVKSDGYVVAGNGKLTIKSQVARIFLRRIFAQNPNTLTPEELAAEELLKREELLKSQEQNRKMIGFSMQRTRNHLVLVNKPSDGKKLSKSENRSVLMGVMNSFLRKIDNVPAMTDPAMKIDPLGGIDLSTQNVNWKVSGDGKIEINVDQAMVARMRREGFNSLRPVIFSITPLDSMWSLIR